jgi:sulfoxide reductase catalytic subunit YedY
MLIQRPAAICPSEITAESVYLARRRFLRQAGLLGMASVGMGSSQAKPQSEPLTSWDDITHYNNFYEYSSDKYAVATLAQNLAPRPWTLRIEGEVAQPRVIDIDQLLRQFAPQQRICRLRCIEGWSMVIPWDGIPLSALLAAAQPTTNARFVKFVSLQDPVRFYGQRRATLAWPYTEGLTLAEAMHPLTLLATGLYGKPLPNQNGAPLRLVVPWKYGFKSIKSIVTIRLQREQPQTTWPQASSDYGFFANVDPRAAYGRGSQSRETRIGELHKRSTLPFNGYASEVAHLYPGHDIDAYR